jgi:hypothetical protein
MAAMAAAILSPGMVKRVQKELAELRGGIDGMEVGVEELEPTQTGLMPHHVRDALMWSISLRGGRVRVCFPPDYPFSPPRFEECANEAGDVIPLCELLGFPRWQVRKGWWSPALTVPRLLAIPPRPSNSLAFLDALPCADDMSVLFISVGCGGPIMRQKYPPPIQALHASGRTCCLVLIDPHLFADGRGAFQGTVLSDSLAYASGPNYRIVYAQIALRKQDLDPFRDAVHAFREQGCDVHLRDHRGGHGAAFGGIDYPLTRHLRADVPEYSDAGAIVRDAIVDDILAATVGNPSSVCDDLLNAKRCVGSSINAVTTEEQEAHLRLKFPFTVGRNGKEPFRATAVDHQIVQLDGGVYASKLKRFEVATWF